MLQPEQADNLFSDREIPQKQHTVDIFLDSLSVIYKGYLRSAIDQLKGLVMSVCWLDDKSAKSGRTWALLTEVTPFVLTGLIG